MRIIHFHRRPFPGQHSMEMLFANLRRGMKSHDIRVDVAEAPHFSRGLGPRVANVRWAARRQGDVNHVTGDVHYVALGLEPERTLLTVHDCLALERLGGIRQWLLKRYWFDLPAKRVAAITVISEETRRQLVRFVPAAVGKTVVIPNAASKAFQPAPREFNAERPRILHIGTTPNKNLPRLAAALEGIPCELRIVGQLNEEQESALRAAGVTFSATANLTEAEIAREYAEADLVAFASTYEGFGMPIVEAQWVERPVVTSNVSSMPEVAGEGACLVDPENVSSIRGGIERVIRDRSYREELIEAGRVNRMRFALERVASQYVELYRAIHDGGKALSKYLTQLGAARGT